jgi:hypothetical protein
MAESNKGIINYGSIGGSATVHNSEIIRGNRTSTEAHGSAVSTGGGTATLKGLADKDPAARLESLMTELKAHLATLPPAHSEAVDALRQQSEAVVGLASSAKPNPTLLKTSCSALQQIGEALGEVAPMVPVLIKGVAAAAAAVAGLL